MHQASLRMATSHGLLQGAGIAFDDYDLGEQVEVRWGGHGICPPQQLHRIARMRPGHGLAVQSTCRRHLPGRPWGLRGKALPSMNIQP